MFVIIVSMISIATVAILIMNTIIIVIRIFVIMIVKDPLFLTKTLWRCW